MSLPQWLIIILSATELLLLFAILLFFLRLRRSEALLNELQQRQGELLAKLHVNAELEQDLMASFEDRQAGLAVLVDSLETKERELTELVHRAEKLLRSPEYTRNLILQGHRKGRTPKELARATGLSMDEVEMILAESRR